MVAGWRGRARSAFIGGQDAWPLAVVKLDRSRYARLMCGRFQSTTSPADLARLFTTTGPLPNTTPRYNAAPTQDLPIVLHGPGTGKRRLVALRWGLIPFWAKDAKIDYTTINAMAETVATTRAFRDAFKSRRCLVPADAFYEWKKVDAKTTQPYRFAMADGAPFAFAGLWDFASGGAVSRFTIITCQPNALCTPIHNRMPVILDSIDHPAWLGEVPASGGELQALLQPYPAERMEAHTIGPRIGNVKNDDAALIERLNVAT
jgi:putative SOS response-associated peptidase YedK